MVSKCSNMYSAILRSAWVKERRWILAASSSMGFVLPFLAKIISHIPLLVNCFAVFRCFDLLYINGPKPCKEGSGPKERWENLFQCGQGFLHTVQSFLQIFHGIGVGDSDFPRHVVGFARDSGDQRFIQ